MSWLEKFMPTASPKPASTAPVNVASNNPPSNAPEPAPQNSPPAQAPQGPVDPLAAFAKMYDNPKSTEAAPSFSLDSEQLGKVAKGQNFMTGMDSALMERATNGDSKALMEMMNLVGQNAYAAALGHGSTLTDKFVSAREAYSSKDFGKRVKGELVNAELGSSVNFKNPVVQKQLRIHAEELQRQNPDASPAEIRQMAVDYVTELANAINPKAAPSSSPAGSTDFDNWLDQ